MKANHSGSGRVRRKSKRLESNVFVDDPEKNKLCEVGYKPVDDLSSLPLAVTHLMDECCVSVSVCVHRILYSLTLLPSIVLDNCLSC